MTTPRQPDDPAIELVEDDAETTLLIDGGQAMQAWERELMHESADMLCAYGSEFLEVGLGLGISALRIAENPATTRHVVVERYARVIELFEARYPSPPPALEVVEADFVDHFKTAEPASLDGIFFDPFLPPAMNNDADLWRVVVPEMVRALRPGGAFIPFATTQPVLRWQFRPFFERVVIERRPFTTYPTTEYMTRASGTAYIQCFIKVR